MNRSLWVLLASIGVVSLCVVLLSKPNTRLGLVSSEDATTQPLQVFCAAANRTVIERIRQDYEKEFGRSIQIQYGSSQAILSALEISKTGDLFIPADDSFMEVAIKKKLVEEILPLAQMRTTIVVNKGNPKNILKLEDLLRDDVRFVQASPDATAIGRLTREGLGKTDMWPKLEKATRGFRTTVTEAATDVEVGAADAAIVFDIVVRGNKDLESVQVDALRDVVAHVSVGVVSSSTKPQASLHFARYLSSRDRGLIRFVEQGFSIQSGDLWFDSPELILYAGSMLRPAIEDTLIRFEKREGVSISRVYNGCGILVAQMKAGLKPDGYFACDSEFMKAVPELFPTPMDISTNRLVILVQKGNPHQIRDLNDLGMPGIRVGIGHEKLCAMGWLTQNVLREGGVTNEVMSNVTVQSPTGDMLVNQMQAGALDAAVAYISNAAGKGDVLDAVQIQGIKCSVATQPFAIRAQSNHAMTMQRLLNTIRSAESRDNFLAEGFSWRVLDNATEGQLGRSENDDN